MNTQVRKTLYRISIVCLFPFLWLLLLGGYLWELAPEYWDELVDLYRDAPKAFRKGAPL